MTFLVNELTMIWKVLNGYRDPTNVSATPKPARSTASIPETNDTLERTTEKLTNELRLKMKEFIQSKPDLYCQVLKYQPVVLEAIHEEMKTAFGVSRLSKKAVIAFFDEMGIIFTSSDR